MKKLIIFLCLIFAGHAWAQSAGGHDGNGGGVVRQADGHWVTFYTAGFYTDPVEALPEEVPQLKNFIDFMRQSPYLMTTTRAQFAKSSIPSAVRHYYRVQSDRFTPEVRAHLIEAFADIVKADPKRITPAAVTDPSTGSTYLLPEFYQLSDFGKMAILYHENYWIVHPAAPYSEVIKSEMAFQAYLENQQSVPRLFAWLKSASLGADLWIAAAQTDWKSHALNGFLSSSTPDKPRKWERAQATRFANLFPVIKFFQTASWNQTKDLSVSLYELTQTYPNSLLMRMFYDASAQGKLHLEASTCGNTDGSTNTDFVECERDGKAASDGINRFRFAIDSDNLVVKTSIPQYYSRRDLEGIEFDSVEDKGSFRIEVY